MTETPEAIWHHPPPMRESPILFQTNRSWVSLQNHCDHDIMELGEMGLGCVRYTDQSFRKVLPSVGYMKRLLVNGELFKG